MSLLTLIVVLPLVGFVLNGLAGNRLGKRFVSAVGCGLPIASFVLTAKCFLDLRGGRLRAARRRPRSPGRQIGDGTFDGRLLVRSQLERGHDPGRDRRRLADPRLLDRLHARGPELRALLRVPQPLPLLHAACWCWASRSSCSSWAGRASGSARYLLIGFWFEDMAKAARRQEGLHRQPHRRRRLPARDVPPLRDPRHAGDRTGSTPRSPASPLPAVSASLIGDPAASSAPPASRRRSRSTSGCPTRWPAPRRSPR